MAQNPLSTEETQKAIGHVNSFASNVINATTRLRNTWLTVYKNYRVFRTEGKQPWQSKLWIPKTFEVIEKIAAKTTANNPKFSLKSLSPDGNEVFTINQQEIDNAIDTQVAAEAGGDVTPLPTPEPKTKTAKDVFEAYLNFVWNEQKLKFKVKEWDKNRLIYGTSHVKIDWEIETQTIVNRKDTKDEEITDVIKVFERALPIIDVIDPFDFLIDPLETDLNTAYGLIHKRDSISVNELDSETYFNLDKILPSASLTEETGEEISKDLIVSNKVDFDPNDFSIYEYWGKFSLTGKPEDEKEYIITIANKSLLIRFEENNGIRPFVAMHDQPIAGEYYAIGEAEPIMSLQEEINHLRNLRQDFANSVLYPEWIVVKGRGVNPAHLQHKPNNIILTEDPTAVQPLVKPQVPISSYQEEDRINRDIQTTTSTIDFTSSGGADSFTNTATGEKIRNQEQNIRIREKVEYLEIALAELGRKILIGAAEHAEDNVQIMIEQNGQQDFLTVLKEKFAQMAPLFRPVVVAGSTSADTPFEKRNDAIAKGNIALQYAGAGVQVNLAEFFKEIMEEGFNTKDVERLISGGGQPQPQVQSSPLKEQLPNEVQLQQPEVAAV